MAAFKLQFGSGRAHTITKKSFLPKDEAERIAQDEIKTNVFAKDETKTDGFDLTERSGRAVKVFSLVIFILALCFTFCILYVFRLNETL